MAQQLVDNIFRKIDKDGSGTITSSEIEDVFKVFDKDGSGDVSTKEWADIFCAEFGGSTDQAQKVFSKLDKDSSGDISLSEVSSLFADMDSDGNGTVTKDEFIERWNQIDSLFQELPQRMP